MKYLRMLLPLFVAAAASPAAHAQVRGAAIYIPGSMYGTYDLELTAPTIFSPYPEGTTTSLTLAIDGSLCAPGLRLRNPFTKDGDTSRVYWADDDVGLELSLDVSAAFSGFELASANSFPYGALTGEKAGARDACDVNSTFFDLAEDNYPELFPESIFVLTRLTTTGFHRYYSVTGITLGISNGVAYARGGPYEGTVLLGDVDELVATGVDNLVVGTAQPVVLPAILTGTYAVSFNAAGPFSPVPSGTTYELALTSGGELCLDDTLLQTPYQDPSDPNLVYWGSPDAGFVLQFDVASSNGTAVQFRMLSDDGLLLGTLSGNRSELLANCAGIVGGNVDLDQANALFTLAEQLHPELFPPSPLTFNQFDGANLLRFYQASGILVTVSGADVYVNGGAYGTTPRRMGTVHELLDMLQRSTPGFVPHALHVSGNLAVEFGNLPTIDRRVERTEASVPRPAATDVATLSTHVRQVLGEELKGTSTFTFSNVVAATDALSFDVRIVNRATIVATNVDRTYTLRFVYTRQ